MRPRRDPARRPARRGRHHRTSARSAPRRGDRVLHRRTAARPSHDPWCRHRRAGRRRATAVLAHRGARCGVAGARGHRCHRPVDPRADPGGDLSRLLRRCGDHQMITQTMPSTPELSASAVPGKAITGLAIRHLRRSGPIVLALVAGMPALVVATYTSVMADPAAAGSIAKLAANPAIRTLFGKPVALDQAGGFTVWRVGTFLAVLLGAWAILATTRITRGEEDAGRWDILLAGRVPMRAVVARHLAV